MKRSIKATLASLSLGMMAAVAVIAAPPADEAVTRAVETFAEATKNLDRSDRDNYGRLTKEAAVAALQGIDLSEASVAQLRKLGQLVSTAGMTEAAAARLEVLARDTGKEGAEAAIARLSYLPSTMMPRQGATDAQRENAAKARPVHEAALQQVVDHPGLAAAMAGSGDLFMALGRVDRQVLASAGPQLAKVASLIPAEVSPETAGSLVAFYDTLSGAQNLEAAARERIRGSIVAKLQAVQGKGKDEDGNRRLANSLAYVDGAHARGQLVGNVSPALDITWTNHAEPIKSIADLKGKVVVLDFWATWCGPCIGSFPNVRELQAHYKDSPVVILGVTSLQGNHIDRPGGATGATKRIDTKGNPDQEYELMNTFVKQLDMTWPVAFTEQNVFNPDYGVRGIPHVAILDPNGVVRYRGMHPGGDKAEKMEKIDGLLREFNLPVPAPAAAPAPATASAG